MMRAASHPTDLTRVANVTVVALCMVSSLVLLGAVPARWATSRQVAGGDLVATAAREAQVVDEEAAATQFASLSIPAGVRLPKDETLAVPAVSAAPAASQARVVRMEVTAYCPCTRCCGSNAQGITASGKLVDYNGGKFVAADTRVLPFGRKLVIPGYADDAPVEVIDRGGAIKGNKLDLYFPTHEEALVWGRQRLDVTVFE